jgi:hypothetical protein
MIRRGIAALSLLLAAACAGFPASAPGDHALCEADPSDQVERAAARSVCR